VKFGIIGTMSFLIGEKADVSEVFAMVQVKVWSWLYSKSRFRMFSFSNWCLDLVVCMRLVV